MVGAALRARALFVNAAGGGFSLASGANDAVDDKVALQAKLDKITAGHVDQCLALFHAMDADHDGKLSRDEWIMKFGNDADFDA